MEYLRTQSAERAKDHVSEAHFFKYSVVFFLFNVLPGDPARMMLGQNENSEQLEATIVESFYRAA